MSPIERLEVFEAKIVSGRANGIEGAPQFGLELEALGDGLDDQIAVGQVLELDGEGEALERGVARPGVELPLLDQLLERLAGSPLAPGEQPRLEVAHHGGKAGGRGRLGDAAAHLSPQPRTPTREISGMAGSPAQRGTGRPDLRLAERVGGSRIGEQA